VATDLVVIGLGYVGLPLAQEACRSGFRVVGLDIDTGVVDGLNAGRSHIDDLGDEDIAAMVHSGFRAVSDPKVIADASNVAICVPTPLAEDGGPDLGAVQAATEEVRSYVRSGTLVMLESTTYPGTTEEILRPALERSGLRVGETVHLAFSPERIDPGNPHFRFRNTPKVVGGSTPACLERARSFYSQIVDTVVLAPGTREAEMAKLLENTYRHVNIALVNEMARFCHELRIDLWEVIRCASSKPFGFEAFYPGPGVGGHCIPIDPNYLSYTVRESLGYPFRFVELAQEINDGMPEYVTRRIQDVLNAAGLAVNGARVLLLGVTYKPDIADQRESPAVPVAERLRELGADVSFHDPYVPEWSLRSGTVRSVDDLDAALGAADISVVLQRHKSYDGQAIAAKAQRVFDTRGLTPRSDTVEHL
jgi:UDP-N-acetyl-D-glucosamine dehydrogenase